jgi:hypothetical protein
MSEAHQERLAKNENLFRTLNENIVGIVTPVGSAGPLGGETPYEFVCECASKDCYDRLLLTLSEYERVRGNGTHFLLVPGHEDIEVEQVIATRDKVVVVEKDGIAGLLADEQDPRA